MKISRIEVFGFKSFLERVILPVDQGITAIVGPNGCGKSNIVDALRWVFGETRASQLRGTHLEDVIFNGTETLRPLGLAEVSLVISTDKNSLFDDISGTRYAGSRDRASSEDGITAQKSQDQESELSSEDGTSDSATSARPRLFVIEGALSGKTTENTQTAVIDSEWQQEGQYGGSAESGQEFADPIVTLSEETGSQEQREVPAGTDGGEPQDPALERFSWLKLSREVEVTRRLYRSGESEFFINKVSCRLRDLKDLFRLLGLGARSYTLVAQGEVSRIITSKPEERRLMIEEAAGVSGVRERLAAARKRLEDTRFSLARLNDLLIEVTRHVNSLRVQATRAKNRAELKDRLKFLDISIIENRLRTFAEQSESMTIEVNLLREREQRSKEHLDSLLTDEESIQRRLVEFNSIRESLSQKLRCGRVELEARKAQRSALESEAQSIEHELRARVPQFEELSQRAAQTSEQLDNAQSELEQFNNSIADLQESISTMERASSEELQNCSLALDGVRRDSLAAQNMLHELRSVSQGLKAKIDAIDEQLNSGSEISSLMKGEGSLPETLSPILSHVYAPEEYRRALEVAISYYSEFFVCQNIKDFVERVAAAENLAEKNINLKAIGLSDCEEVEIALQPFPRLIDHLDIASQYRPLFEKLIGNVFICENISQALSLLENGRSDSGKKAVFVTLAGELLSSDTYSIYGATSGPVEKYARRREMLEQYNLNEEAVLAAAENNQNLQIMLQQAEEQHAAALNKSVTSEHEIRSLSSELGALRGKAEVISRLVSQLTTEKNNIEVSLGAWDIERESLNSRLEDLRNMLQISGEEDSGFDQDSLDSLEEELDQINSQGKDLIDSLEQRSRDRDSARSEYEEVTALRSRAEFDHEKVDMERQAVLARLHDLYPEIIASELAMQSVLSQDEQDSYAEEAERLRTRIQREGEVDPSSIELFEQEQTRLEELKAQKTDLESAEKTLEETVEQLSELARKRFLDTFKIVQANFARLIPRVFGGGFGALHLENTEDPFEGGIEVSVRPPGKKPKSIELLSGGERALCAIALIFSMFLHKPSPLCVLDEVDAPLDEANLRRYLMMVREMSSVTQFLMISHNKEAMAAADRLVGVTQEQPGASRIVTVSLEQAQAVAG